MTLHEHSTFAQV